MMWTDPVKRARQLAAAGEHWNTWSEGMRTSWSKEVAKLSSPLRQSIWVGLSVTLGWRAAKKIHEYYREITDGQTKISGAGVL